MESPQNDLLATVLGPSDSRRVNFERELVAIGRDVALGRLAADVAHDIANPLFAMIGLAELLLMDAEPGSEAHERLTMIRDTGLGLKDTLQDLLELARAEETAQETDLVAAVRTAVRAIRRGRGKYAEIVERYPDEPVRVACSAPLVVQAALHLLTGARDAERLEVEVTAEGALRVAPVHADAFEALAAGRIAADCGGALEGGTLRLPLA